MRAWVVETPGPVDGQPLRLVEREAPLPGPGEVRVAVSVCGVCRTDLHLAEGDLTPHVWRSQAMPMRSPRAKRVAPGPRASTTPTTS